MKIHRFPLLVSLLILGTFLLSACTGVGAINTFPGITATQNTVYLADQGSIFAINAANGTMTWRFPEKPDNSKPFYAPPAVTDNLIVAGNYGNMLYGLDTSGKQKWAFDSKGGHFVGGPLVVKDTVLAPSSNNNLYALNAADGTQRWAYETKNAVWATPVSDGQIIYQPALDHNLYALKLADGSLVWKKDLGSALLSAPILTKDGTLYLSSMGGDVIAVKASDGSVLWTAKIGGRIWSTPAFNQDLLFVGNSDGKVFAVSANGRKMRAARFWLAA
jgi:outer membrane protein assembly factor BamB